MRLATPRSAALSALIFDAVIIPLLLPLALRGVQFRAETAQNLFQRNLWISGLGGLIAPFVGIKLIDAATNSNGSLKWKAYWKEMREVFERLMPRISYGRSS